MDFSEERLQKYKWPISVSKRINASPQQIWSTITTPGILKLCHPFCKENPVYRWPGAEARDAVHYYSGWILYRDFVQWLPGVGYDLLIGREGGEKSYVRWRITEENEQTGTLIITIYPYIFQNLPVVIRWVPYRFQIIPQLRDYLVSVLKGFEWYITTGQPVKKNQFGTHRWFSSPD
ncbi:MAG: hypothetical protein D6748_06040 [Calditrichaeota bacterium]|nr:MAG: hypothetical protein D6748_06040 [Calditrichota bacterium]